MKILLTSVAHHIDQPGGSQKIAHDEAVELKRRGHDVWVLAHGAPGLPEYEVRDGINVLRYLPRKASFFSPRRRNMHQLAVKAVLAKHLPHIDALHGFIQLSYVAAMDFYGPSLHSSYTITSPLTMEMELAWKNGGGVKKLLAPAGLFFLKRVETACLRRSTVVTAMSRYTIECIRKIYGAELASRLELVPGWVDTARYIPMEPRDRVKQTLQWPTNVPTLFTLRRLVPRMGLERLVEACARLHSEGVRFHLVIGGGGPLREHLQAQAKSQGVAQSVTFMGRVPEENMPLAYAACDAFVLPTSDLECFGLIALEALSAGRPVLATPVGAIPEIMEKVEPAWLASSASADSIADLLRSYLAGGLPEHSATELRAIVERDYRVEDVLDHLIRTTVEQPRA